MTIAQKKWIDNASYVQLLDRWRFAPAGDKMFIGDTGDYYSKMIKEKRALEQDNGVGASKLVGWERS